MMSRIRALLGATLSVLFFACGDSGGGSDEIAPETTAVESAEETSLPTTPGSYKIPILVDGYQRIILLEIPDSYNPAAPAPLILVFHGSGGSASDFRGKHMGLVTKAASMGILLAYMQGIHTSGAGFGWFSFDEGERPVPEGIEYVDDRAYVLAIVEALQTQLNLDAKRTYIAGMSGGGRMVHYLASKSPDVFAAAASVSSAIAGPIEEGATELLYPPESLGPIPMLIINGRKDGKRPWEGGINIDGAMQPAVQEAVDWWVDANGCNPTPTITFNPQNTVEKDHYTGGLGASEVILYALKKMSHIWPDAGDNVHLDANQVIPDFLLQHSK